MLTDQTYRKLVLQAHQSATDPSQWDALVASVANAFSASSALLMTPGEQDTHERFLWSNYGLDPEYQTKYGQQWATQDPWLQAVEQKRMPMSRGALHIGESYLPREALRRTAFYNEFAAHAGIEGLATLIVEGKGQSPAAPMTVLSLLRRPNMEPFGSASLEAFRALHPHLHQATTTHWLLAEARRRAFCDALDASPLPMFLLSSAGGVDYANAAGERLTRSADVICHRSGRLESFGRMEPGALLSAVRMAARGVGQVLTTWWQNSKSSHLVVSTLRLSPLSEKTRVASTGVRAAVLLTVEIHDASLRLSAIQDAVARHYRLTPAEIRVLDATQRGMTPEEMALEFGVQMPTIRTHLASLRRKTGCKRQSELLRLDHPPRAYPTRTT